MGRQATDVYGVALSAGSVIAVVIFDSNAAVNATDLSAGVATLNGLSGGVTVNLNRTTLTLTLSSSSIGFVGTFNDGSGGGPDPLGAGGGGGGGGGFSDEWIVGVVVGVAGIVGLLGIVVYLVLHPAHAGAVAPVPHEHEHEHEHEQVPVPTLTRSGSSGVLVPRLADRQGLPAGVHTSIGSAGFASAAVTMVPQPPSKVAAVFNMNPSPSSDCGTVAVSAKHRSMVCFEELPDERMATQPPIAVCGMRPRSPGSTTIPTVTPTARVTPSNSEGKATVAPRPTHRMVVSPAVVCLENRPDELPAYPPPSYYESTT